MVLDKANEACWTVPDQQGTPVSWRPCSSTWLTCRLVASIHLVLVYVRRVAIFPRLCLGFERYLATLLVIMEPVKWMKAVGIVEYNGKLFVLGLRSH
jgi:hypothetical protein